MNLHRLYSPVPKGNKMIYRPLVGNGILDALGPIGGVAKAVVPALNLLSLAGLGRKKRKSVKGGKRKTKK